MQKILIGVNTELYGGMEDFVSILIKELGKDEDFWCSFIFKHSRLFRTSKTIHEVVKKYNYIIGNDYEEDEIVKIVEVPDDVKWHIETYGCAVGEYVCENYRTWD